MDKDKNGVLSFVEFSSRNERAFSFYDQNSDGNISWKEMDSEEELRSKRMLTKLADRLDSNDDQRIDQKEFITGSKSLNKQRHKFKRKEPSNRPSPEQRKDISEAIFKALDKDKDGYINDKELEKESEIRPKVAREVKFKKLDSNKNNLISKAEFMSPVQKKFTEIDQNSDDLLDRKELMASFKGKKDKHFKDKKNMWKGRPPVMHKERIRH